MIQGKMTRRVLYIEDDPALRGLVERVLKGAGIATELAETGLAGIEKALASPPDLVLVDLGLPDLQGHEIATRLRASPRLAKVPIVAFTGAVEDRTVALAAGCDGFIEKPIEIQRFAADVLSFLEGRRDRLPAAEQARGLVSYTATLAAHLEARVGDLTRANERLREIDRFKNDFMRSLSHALGSPLTPLAGYLKILQGGKLGILSDDQKRVLDSMASSLSRLSRLVDNLVEFAGLESGEMPLAEGSVDPDVILKEVAADLAGAAKAGRVTIKAQGAGGGILAADGRKLRQALANVVENAVRHSPAGGEVLVQAKLDDGRLRLSVWDQGPGFDPADIPHAFEPFFHSRREKRGGGSGLGLPVARRIIDAHGGKVILESPPLLQPDGTLHGFSGTRVVLEIPARPPAG
jgi:signal transduction histidine kinase